MSDLTDLRERVARLERQRDELINLRDVHGGRLSAIEGRLAQIERDLSENESWLTRRFDDIDELLAVVIASIERLDPSPKQAS